MLAYTYILMTYIHRKRRGQGVEIEEDSVNKRFDGMNTYMISTYTYTMSVAWIQDSGLRSIDTYLLTSTSSFCVLG